MAVAVASAPKLDNHVADASYSYGNGLKSSTGHANGLDQSLSPFNSGHFDFGGGHFDVHHGHVLRCCKCSCLPADCQCVESHPEDLAYSPNPNETDIPREYETHVQIFVRVPEMQEVEETHYKKEVVYEKQKASYPTSVLVLDAVEHFEMVPRVRYVTKTRPEIEYHPYQEEIEITVIEQCVEYEEVCVIRNEPRVITEEVEEIVQVPVVKEVKVTKMCDEWTGHYRTSEVEKFCSPGDFNLICEDSHHHSFGNGHIRKSRSSASSMSAGDSPSYRHSASKAKKSPAMMEKDLMNPKKSHSMTEADLKAAALKTSLTRTPIF